MKGFIFQLLFFFLFFQIQAAESQKKTICVNMIVKNETAVIRRCLASVKPVIDYWVIVDTGSTDGTQEMIKDFMKDIPGELHERPWKNFEHNRNEALQLAKEKGDYILIIDADEVLEFDHNFLMPLLDKDYYHITTKYGGLNYTRTQLINNKLNWKWIGVLHEYLDAPDAKTTDLLKGVYNVPRTDGARSQDPQKFYKDAKILEEALEKDPSNSRNRFYLAQSYMDAGDYSKAIENYQKRIEMGGWNQEVYWSMLKVATCQQLADCPPETFLESFQKVFMFRPSRIEALYYMANHHRQMNNYDQAYQLLTAAMHIPPSKDNLFVQQWMYDYGLMFELSIDAYWAGHYEESLIACDKLLKNPYVPDEYRDYILVNRQYSLEKCLDYTSVGAVVPRRAVEYQITLSP